MLFVDRIRHYPDRRRCDGAPASWCHLATDSELAELHAFARRLGAPPTAFHAHPAHPHYDLTPRLREVAVTEGAVEVTSKELVRRCFRRRTSR